MLPSKELISARLELGDFSCATCGANVESTFHIIKECPGSKAIAFCSKWGAKFEGWPGKNSKDLIQLCLDPPKSIWEGFIDKDKFTIFALSFLYSCWQFRNDKVFSGKSSIYIVATHFDRVVADFTSILNYSSTFEVEDEEKWSPLV